MIGRLCCINERVVCFFYFFPFRRSFFFLSLFFSDLGWDLTCSISNGIALASCMEKEALQMASPPRFDSGLSSLFLSVGLFQRIAFGI